MSFYTSLTGLQAATTELGVTSNNIANAGTTGFKRADASFGDIYSSTPLQKAGSIGGSGVALKGIVQQHTQGNIEFSTNTLDLAITGDGYFKLKTSDGGELFTRNGGFMLNDQNQLVNSAGQALQILPVDSVNNANFEAQTTGLTIQRSTVGEFMPTTEIDLGLNLPSSAVPITATFNANKPETYHKTTSFTTYGSNGNAQLATIYYVKTADPSDASPFSKWQTHVTIDGATVKSALTQSAGPGNDIQYINKYGEIKTKTELDAYTAMTRDPVTGAAINQAEYLVTAGTTYRKYSLDQLKAPVVSESAAVITEVTAGSSFLNGLNLTSGSAGVNFQDAALFTNDKLDRMFSIKVDGSNWREISLPRMMSLSHLGDTGPGAVGAQTLSGKQIATELTNEINRAFSDEPIFDLSTAVFGNLNLKRYVDTLPPANIAAAADSITIDIEAALEATNAELEGVQLWTGGTANNRTATGWQVAAAITNNLRYVNADKANWADVTVQYDEKNQGFKIYQTKATPDVLRIGATTADLRTLFGDIEAVADNDLSTTTGTLLTSKTVNRSEQLIENVRGNGDALTAADRRSGIEVTYAGGKFTFSSGKTGDASSIEIKATETAASAVTDGLLTDGTANAMAYTPAGLLAGSLLGLSANATLTRAVNNANQVTAEVSSLVENIPTVRGQASIPAVLTGNTMGVDTDQAFQVNANNQSVTAVVDGLTNTIKLTIGQYNIDTFTAELQTQINRMADANGKTVSNVTVGFDTAKGALKITGATASSDSYIQLIGSQDWGLRDLDVAFGKTTEYAKIDADQSVGSNLYVTQNAKTGLWTESTDKADFDAGNIPYWTPIFLDRGEISFNTAGALVSPQDAYQLESSVVAGGIIELSYKGSTQYDSAFAAITQSQNGKPEGDLNGLSIGDDGLVTGSYSNGTQLSLGKIVIANFNSSAGLKQLGDTSWTATAESGVARLGEAGDAGYGTIRSGSRERSNVDLTTELVDLIAAQRNFQANAKAIETNSAMTSAIINIRG